MADSINESSTDMQFKYDTPKQEIDEPLIPDMLGTANEPLDTRKLEIEEKDKDHKEKRYT